MLTTPPRRGETANGGDVRTGDMNQQNKDMAEPLTSLSKAEGISTVQHSRVRTQAESTNASPWPGNSSTPCSGYAIGSGETKSWNLNQARIWVSRGTERRGTGGC